MKKHYIISAILLLTVCAYTGWAKKITVLPDVSRPNDLIVTKDRAYVIEGTSIFIYSLKDLKLIKKFGQNGEGPKEFKVRPSGRVKIYPLDNYLYVNSVGKMSVFTTNGIFVRETKAVTGRNFMPLGHSKATAVGRITEGKKAYRTVDIFDSNLKKTKTVFRQPDINQGQAIRVFFTSIACRTYKNKLFITGREGFFIDAFDDNGKKLFTINRDFQKIKITDQVKKNVLAWFKADPRYDERRYQIIKANIRFPEYFPAIDELRIRGDRIYVRTHNVKNDDYEFVIFDINGKYLKTQFIHLFRDNPMYPHHYDLANGNAYQVVENLDNETWEFHCTPIE